MKALTAWIQETNIQGVSTQSVDDLVKAMDLSDIAWSEVCHLCEEIDNKVRASGDRPKEVNGPISGSTPPI